MLNLNAVFPNTPSPPEGVPTDALPPDSVFTGDKIQMAGLDKVISGIIGKAAKTEKAAAKAADAAKQASPLLDTAPPPPKPKKPKKPKAEAKPQTPPPPAPDDLPPTLTADEQAALDALAHPQPVDPARTVLRNFSAEKLNTTDDIKALIDQRAAQYQGFMDQRRGVVSHDQTYLESAAVDVAALIGNKPGQAFNAAQLAAGRDVLVSLSEQVSVRAKWLDSNPATATPADLLEFRQQLAELTAVQKWFQGAVSEAGRALNILGVNARQTRRFSGIDIQGALDAPVAPGSVTAAQRGATDAAATAAQQGAAPATGLTRHEMQRVSDTLNDLGGAETTLALARMIANTEGPEAVLKATRMTWQKRTMGAVQEYWINGLLSNPATHLANISSNGLFDLINLAEHAAASGVGRVRHAIGRKAERESMGEVFARAHGLLEGKVDGLRVFAKLAKGQGDDLADKLEMNLMPPSITASNFGVATDSAVGRAINAAGSVIRFPGHMMVAEDGFFKVAAMRSSLRAQAYAQATREGLEGAVRDQRIQAIINNPPEDFIDAAKAEADYLTFTQQLHGQEGAIAQMGAKVQAFTATNPGARFVVPFVRTPTNISLAILERTPLAPLSRRYRDAMTEGGRAADLANARWLMGSTMGYGFYSAALEGRISGGGPSDPKLRQQWLAAGFRPYSIRVGDEWVNYSRLDPLGGLIGMAANAAESVRAAELTGAEVDMGAVAAALGLGFTETMTDKAMLTGVAQLLDALKSGEDNPAKMRHWLSRFGGSFVPSVVAATEQVLEPRISAPNAGNVYDETWNVIQSRIPGWSADVPAKIDNFGNEITFTGFPFSPAKVATDVSEDPKNRIRRQLLADGVSLTVPTAVVSVPRSDGRKVTVNLLSVDPSGQLLNDYQRQVGIGLRDHLMGNEATYGTYTDPNERVKFIEGEITRRRGEIRDEWTASNAIQLQSYADAIPPETQKELTPP